LKCCPNAMLRRAAGCAALAVVCVVCVRARADLAPWMQDVVSGSAIEAALYRVMSLPGMKVMYPRPAAEARGQMDALVKSKPEDAQLYALRAHVDEQALDFAAAEQDWKTFAAKSGADGTMQLADFYARRVEGPQEIAALEQAAAFPAEGNERFLAADQQRAWQAFARATTIVHDDALGDDAMVAIYAAWVARYPQEPAVRAEFFGALLKMKRHAAAQQVIAAYQQAFPKDTGFPVEAAALLALEQGGGDAERQAIAQFDKNYQPLEGLSDTYFQLLSATHTQHAMLDAARTQLAQHPDDLNAATRIFYFYQHEGRTDVAVNVLAEYGASKQSRHVAWSADELHTFAELLTRTGQYPLAVQYDFALAATPGTLAAVKETPEEAGMAGAIGLLLAHPESAIALGAGNLSIYRDAATLDNGPGYLNGVLSLWLNSASPASEMSAEEDKATPYFHRGKAAELLRVFDEKFPASAERPALHAALIRTYAGYGDDFDVKRDGEKFLADFPHASERMEVAMEVADADSRANDTKDEFALYDSLLTELSGQLQGMPLTAGTAATQHSGEISAPQPDEHGAAAAPAGAQAAAKDALKQALTLPVRPAATSEAAAEYEQILERYLGRLTMAKQYPEALAVLRKELDRNPNDPMLYERLADFLQQNNLGAEQEAVYQKAIARFHDESFYDKLARFYVRSKREKDYVTLSKMVVDTFAGTELEAYFAQAGGPWPQEFLQLNLYAHKRFPHELMFTRNLLAAYQAKGTVDAAARETLMREHWQDAPDLQAEFIEWLSQTNKLDTELAALEKTQAADSSSSNTDAMRELAELEVSRSHFEQSAPLLGALAQAYPADEAVGDEAASVFRSLAYHDPAQIDRAVAIEKNLSAADPANLDRLAAIGDTYADSTSSELNLDAEKQLAQAAPYWQKMAAVHPGVANGYLQSATVFWDYYEFDRALAEIDAARKQLHDPALYGYEAGAIDENKDDMAGAVKEYVSAAIAKGSDDGGASDRLATLAGRKSTAALVDQTMATAVAQHATLNALQLRASVLAAQDRSTELAATVETAVQHATTLEDEATLANFSSQHQLTHAYQLALAREIALSGDAVEKMELEYELVRTYESAGNTAAAQTIVEAVYKQNPLIVGVVRSTADFYWTSKQQKKAIATLLEASHKANVQMGKDFLLEAIAKSSESGDSAGARALLKPLLAAEPYNAKYMELEADSYAQAHDDAGLRDFYAATLASVKTAKLSAAEKRDTTALAWQGMIVALTDLKDYAGAMDQHIAMVSAFPEDDGALQAATSYARLHQREAQLVAFLNKAVVDSPRDSRFAIDLARVDASFEDSDGALAAYSKAIAIRQDRADLYMARAAIEEQQQSFDAACADYDRLYVLTYSDPQWMVKEALARARQAKPELAAKALQAAWIDGSPATASNYFRVADQLQQWDMLEQARPFVDQGAKLAGDDLLRDSQYSGDAVIYARVLGRQRKTQEAVALLIRLHGLGGGSSMAPSVVVQQVEEHGIAAVTDAQWRKSLIAHRQQMADANFNNALAALGQSVATYYTPEEKLAYAKLLDSERASRPASEVAAVWIPAAAAAGLLDREAQWQRELILQGGTVGQIQTYNTLESDRMNYRVLGETLDRCATTQKPEAIPGTLEKAERAWANAGDISAEINDLRKLAVAHKMQGFQNSLFALMLRENPSGLILLARGKEPIAEAATNYVLAHGTKVQAYQAVAAHAMGRDPAWGQATRALAGLYYGDSSAVTDTAFEGALADGTIGVRLGKKFDASRQLTGATWFYYAMRYGVLLTLPAKPGRDAEDFLAAGLEQSDSAENFNELAKAYVDAHRYDEAIVEYRHAEEMDTDNDATPNVAIAQVLWTQGKQNDAVTEWGVALTRLRAMVDANSVPENFWTNFAAIAQAAHDHGLGEKLKPGMNDALEAYIRKNSSYRAMELLSNAALALGKENPAETATWMMALVGDAGSDVQASMLDTLTREAWFPAGQLDQVYQREILLVTQQEKAANVAAASADASNAVEETGEAASSVTPVKLAYVRWLMKSGKNAAAQQVLDSIGKKQQSGDVTVLQLLLAARLGKLQGIIAGYEKDSAAAPSFSTLSEVANQLRVAKDWANSRAILEYVFEQKLEQQQLQQTDYLALAEARLNTNDLPGALDLLHRLTMQGDLYANLDAAASLLIKTGHTAEALPLLTKLANGVPWNASYRLRLGEAQAAIKLDGAAASLAVVAANPNAAYSARAEAAMALHPLGAPVREWGSAELAVLAGGTPTAQQAAQPYFVYARMAAATGVPAAQKITLLEGAMLIAPDSLRDWLRLQIFEAGVASGKYDVANAAIQPLLASQPWMRSVPSEPAVESESAEMNDADAAATANDDEAVRAAGTNQNAAYSLTEALRTDEEKVQLEMKLSEMDERLGNMDLALEDLQAARARTTDTAQKKILGGRASALQSAIARDAENTGWRPVIKDELLQSVVVRPRLTGAASARVGP
jgi:transcriptional regulator with XRE-family HTH domain